MRRLAIVVITFGLMGCQTGDPDPPFSPSPTPTPSVATPAASESSQEVDKDTVRLQRTTIKNRQGQKWELEADTVDWNDQRSEADAEAVVWWLQGEDEEPWVKVESPHADIDMTNQIVVFTGETFANRIGFPESLTVQRLVYNGKKKTFHGSGGVVWRREPQSHQAGTTTPGGSKDLTEVPVEVVSPEADFDLNSEVVVFTGETVASRIDSEESLKVQKLVYKGKESMFYGTGGVVWDRVSAQLKGETLTATSTLDKVQVKGAVKGKFSGEFKGLKDSKEAE